MERALCLQKTEKIMKKGKYLYLLLKCRVWYILLRFRPLAPPQPNCANDILITNELPHLVSEHSWWPVRFPKGIVPLQRPQRARTCSCFFLSHFISSNQSISPHLLALLQILTVSLPVCLSLRPPSVSASYSI